MPCCSEDPFQPKYFFNSYQSKFPENFCKRRGVSNKLNPGNVQNIHEKARKIMPDWIDGVQLHGNRVINGNSSVFASWVLGHAQPSGFRFGGSFTQQISSSYLKTPHIEADINPYTFATNLRLLHHPTPQIGLNYNIQFMPWNIRSSLATIEYIGGCHTMSMTLHDPRKESGRMTVANLYNVTPKISVGAEFLLEWYNGRIFNQLALAGRYMTSTNAVAATVSRNAMDVTVWTKINDTLQIGSSFVWNKKKQKNVGEIFYQWESNDTVIRGGLDSNFAVGFTYTKIFKEISSAFGVSLLYSQLANKLICGFKLELDSNLA